MKINFRVGILARDHLVEVARAREGKTANTSTRWLSSYVQTRAGAGGRSRDSQSHARPTTHQGPGCVTFPLNRHHSETDHFPTIGYLTASSKVLIAEIREKSYTHLLA